MIDRSRSIILGAGGLAGLLLLLPACTIGPGILGDATETDTGSGSDTAGSADDTETGVMCTEDCDPDFAVTFLSAINSESRRIHLLGSSTCEGPSCPSEVTPAPLSDGPVVDCLASEEALASPLGPQEYCRPGAVSAFPYWVGFQTPVQRESFERMRARPDAPTMEEAYLWYESVVRIEGPGTAFRGDYHAGSVGTGDRVESVVNEACADRLTALGQSWTEAELETLCVATWDDGGELRPLRMDPSMVFRPKAGRLSTNAGLSCDTPDSGPDTCCSSCDHLLGTRVARYGVDEADVPRNPNDGTAITCDPAGDPLVECADLRLRVDRQGELNEYVYAWDGAAQAWAVPRYDKLRETHPDDRPAGVETVGASCSTAGDCDEGQQCIGTNGSGQACTLGDDCLARSCRSEWFGACAATTGGVGYCHDRRYSSQGAGACLAADVSFGAGSAGDRLAQCDANGDGTLTSGECCDPALGGGPGCDPLTQSGVAPIDRYDRHPTLSDEAMCACEAGQPDACAAAQEAWCEPPLGAASDPGPASVDGDYAVPLVAAGGGVRWDEQEGVLTLRLADVGNEARSQIESCAEARGLVGGRSVADGWLANEAFPPDLYEDHDLALCSGSSYRLVFESSDAEHHVRSEAGGTLDGRAEHVFETSQLRVVPQSLFPTDNLTIETCTEMRLVFSAQYDLSPSNIEKIAFHEGTADGPRVAGGPGCVPEATPEEIAMGAVPCLRHGVDDHLIGEVSVGLDRELHSDVLVPGTTYVVVVPGLSSIDEMADPVAYAQAFHDACGMPLVLGDTPELVERSWMSFTVDEPCFP